MRTIAILFDKSGCGKSTIAVNLAVAQGGAILDVDPRQSVTRSRYRRRARVPLINVPGDEIASVADGAVRHDGVSFVILDMLPHSGKDPMVLHAVAPVRSGRERAQTAQATEALAVWQVPICPVAIANRAVYRDALADGLTGPEVDRNGPAAAEIASLCPWVKAELVHDIPASDPLPAERCGDHPVTAEP